MKRYSVGGVFVYTIKKHKGITLGLLAALIAATILDLLPPLILGTIVDRLTDHRMISIAIVLAYFAVSAVSGLSESLKEVFITIFGQKITHGLRTAMSEKLARLSALDLHDQSSGELSSRFVNDVDTVEDLFSSGIFSMVADLTSVISILFVIFTKSIGLGILLVIALPLLFILTRVFQKRMLKAQVDNRQAIGKENAHIPETITNRRTIHVFHIERFMEKKYADYIDDSFQAMERSNFYDASYSPIIITSSAIIIAIMMSLAGAGSAFRAFFGMSVGSAVTLIAYVNQIFSPLESIGMEIESIQSAAAGITRIQEFMKMDEEDVPHEVIDELAEPAIQVNDLTFGYDQHQVLHHFSLTIHSGEHVTLTGRTGCGKSTLLKLMMGLYQPESGAVTVYGHEASAIADQDRRQIFGYVEQDFVPVEGDLRMQLTLGDTRVSDAQIDEALAVTGMADLIHDLPEGLHTPYDPALFSQGERQLFSIARAIVFNPKILLLDEITANLDASTEKLLMRALHQASEGRTVVSVSHRLYTNTDDRIIQM